jgi:pimeloyl-ACP methyl ester carboxylesterase
MNIANTHNQGASNRRGCLFQLGRGLLVLVVLLAACNLLGLIYQQAAEASDRQAYPPPGQLIDVGSYRLHIHCLGEGQPTVILEAGTGGSSLDWSLVQPDAAATTRTCAYDRAGYGWSDSATSPRTSQQVAAELHTLLTNANIDGPYVLVGHSIGVIHTEAYLDAYPDEVAGLVMVDRPAAEYLTTSSLSDEEILATEGGSSPSMMAMMRVLSTVGFIRATGFGLWPITSDLPTEVQPVYNASTFQTRFFASLGDEWATYPTNLRYGAALPPVSRDLPVVVLIHAPIENAGPNEAVFYEDRVAFAAHVPDARVVIAGGSNHFINTKRPDLVIQAIQDVVKAARSRQLLASK